MTERPSWLFGTGATRVERALVFAAAGIALGLWWWTARDTGWVWWRYAVGAVIVFDLAGGVVSLGLHSAKRFYQNPLPPPRSWPRRLLHSHLGFTAVHVQPIVVGLVFGAAWWWGPLWYAWALAGVVLVIRAPMRLARPLALLTVLAGVLAAAALPASAVPPGFGWLPTVLLLKLVLAHAVPEPSSATAAPSRR